MSRKPGFLEIGGHDFRSPKGSRGETEDQIENSEKRPHIKAASRDASVVSIVRGGRMFCNFAGRQQLVEGAPVSRMPFCGLHH